MAINFRINPNILRQLPLNVLSAGVRQLGIKDKAPPWDNGLLVAGTRQIIVRGNLDILAVDDDREILDRYQAMLSGHRIVCCRDGSEAVQAIKRERFHLVITDWNFPEGGGERVMGEVRELSRSVPIIVASKNSQIIEDLGLAHEAIGGEAGRFLTLVKPVRAEDVKNFIDQNFVLLKKESLSKSVSRIPMPIKGADRRAEMIGKIVTRFFENPVMRGLFEKIGGWGKASNMSLLSKIIVTDHPELRQIWREMEDMPKDKLMAEALVAINEFIEESNMAREEQHWAEPVSDMSEYLTRTANGASTILQVLSNYGTRVFGVMNFLADGIELKDLDERDMAGYRRYLTLLFAIEAMQERYDV